MITFDEPVCRTCNSTNIETRLPNLDYCRKCGSSKDEVAVNFSQFISKLSAEIDKLKGLPQ